MEGELSVPVSKPCPACGGTGKDDKENACKTCGGNKRLTEYVGLYEFSILMRGAVQEKRGHARG